MMERKRRLSRFAAVGILCLLVASPAASAITLGQVDDFQDGTTASWSGALPANVPNSGPAGAGDNALSATATGSGGANSRLIINNSSQWAGDWTAAGVEEISLDLRNPSGSPLTMRLAIAGPGGFGGGGLGDTYATIGTVIPADNQWHPVAFDVTPGAWQYVGQFGGTSIAQALANVTQFRILHNPDPSFIGDIIPAGFFVDNIAAVASQAGPTGDYNGNGIVDAADYVLWRKTLNQPAVPNGSGADGNESGTIDLGDFNFWFARFGNVVSGAGGSAGTVPEPAAATLLSFGVACFLMASRKRPRS